MKEYPGSLRVGQVVVRQDVGYEVESVAKIEPTEGEIRIKVDTVQGPTFYFRPEYMVEVLQ